MAHDTALRRHIDARLAVLKRQRQSWEPGWRELSRFVNPRRGSFFSSPNQGGRGAQANGAILDPTALFALRTLVADLTPIRVPLGLYSVQGAWQVTTGANVSVIAVGRFS